MQKETKEIQIRKYITLLSMTDKLLDGLAVNLHQSQAVGVNGMYDIEDKNIKELNKGHISFLRKELKRSNRKRKEDLRLLRNIYEEGRSFNKMILKMFGGKDVDQSLVEKINKLFV
jgi:hypothetical protein